MITFRLRCGTDGAAGLTCGVMLLHSRFFSGASKVLELSLAFRANVEFEFDRG